ncbi:MAG: hypothetical protein AB7E49_06210 [Campylobacterales bacterium]
MAKIPTPQETAIRILDIFVNHFNCRPDHVLRINNFIGVWHKKGLHWEDFVPGMEYAAETGLVEVLEGGVSFRLTQTGFDACPSSSASQSRNSETINHNYINIGQAINTPITQGIGSTQNVTANYSSMPKDELVDFVNSFRENIADLQLSTQDERKVNAQLATIEAQLIDEPNKEILKHAFATIKNITEGAIGSLLATAAQPGVWAGIKALLSSL